ncbi:hypothetical protein EW026_g7605 [Hermanssonia centrifuga]|uniref:DUF6534 domain-containing protein n=1 Tax=Hermanssonia centrifuga TaxID=98765 RepID=A0A4S4KBP2_9APHY|nr:hypothetical protein EW026_g7605 [Hermanssonia centrifuga]
MQIFILLIADITNSVFDIYWLYTDIILNFGNAQALGIADWRIATDPAMVAIIATMVQLFFAWRVKVLTGNIWITGLIVVTAIVSCCGGLGVAIAIHFVKLFENFYKFDQIGTIWLISTAVCDTAIALTLTWHLKKHKTGISRTDDILDRIVRLTVQNGAITAIWAIVDLILFLSIPTGVHLALNLPLAKLYTNSLMSSLNARSAWRFNPESTDKYGANTLGTAKSAPMPDFVKLGANTQTHAQAVVTVEQHELNDIEARGDDGQWSERSAGHEAYTTVGSSIKR